MTLKETLRLNKNRELVKLLSNLVEQNPHLRFSQILPTFGFVKEERPAKPEARISWQNEFYTEPEHILERVKTRVEDI